MLNLIVLSQSINLIVTSVRGPRALENLYFLNFFIDAVHSKVRGFLEATLSIYMRDWITYLQETG